MTPETEIVPPDIFDAGAPLAGDREATSEESESARLAAEVRAEMQARRVARARRAASAAGYPAFTFEAQQRSQRVLKVLSVAGLCLLAAWLVPLVVRRG